MASVMCGGSAHANAREHNNSIRPRTLGHAPGRRQVLRTRAQTNHAKRREDVRTWPQDAMNEVIR